MAGVKPPRGAFLNFPLGHQCGKPNEPELQARILKDALNVLATATVPGEIENLPYEWDSPFDFPEFLRGIENMLKEQGERAQDWRPQG